MFARIIFYKLKSCITITTTETEFNILRTKGAHLREIPTTLNNRMELLYTRPCFCIIMKMVCAWLRTKLKETKSAMLLSSTHTENSVITDECQNLLMILDYNQRKGGVDSFDENLDEVSCRRKTIRWPLLFFSNMVDAAANNAYILIKNCGRYSKSKICFLKNLSFQ